MVNFRFHLVSLTAVFLALALGIAVGATVLDRSTVSVLEDQLNRVQKNVNESRSQSKELQADLARWNQFAEQAGDRLVKGRLAGVPVVVIAVEGIERAPIDATRQTLIAAGATLQGTLWLGTKLGLRDNDDVVALRQVLNTPSAQPADLRRIVAAQVAAGVTDTTSLPPLAALVDRGFARVEAAGGAAIGAAGLVVDSARFVVVSDGKAAAPNPELAEPLVAELAARAPARVLAAEDGRDARGNDPAVRAQFLTPLRTDSGLKISSVDDLEQYAGRIAAVFALQAMGEGRIGHYGVGPRAARLLPDAPA
jgi:hypothetical protein